MTIKPYAVTEKITIGLIAPSSSASIIKPQFIKRALHRLKSRGIEIVVGQHIYGNRGGASGTVEERLEDFSCVLNDANVQVIMPVFGGFNSNDLVSELDYDLIRTKRKIFTGYSDTTALHTAIQQMTGLTTYYGPSFITFCKPFVPDFTYDYFFKALAGSPLNYQASKKYYDGNWWSGEGKRFPYELKNEGPKVYREGEGEGRLIGGHLGAMLTLSGTEYFPNLDGKILIVESSDNNTFQELARGLTHLKQMGALSKLAGLAMGRFCSQTLEGRTDADLIRVFADVLPQADYPIVYNLDFGHTDPIFTIPIGIKSRLNAKNNQVEFMTLENCAD